MKTRSSGKAVEVDNSGRGAARDSRVLHEAKSAGKSAKTHKRKSGSGSAEKEVESYKEVKQRVSVSKGASKNKEAGTEGGGKTTHFSDNVEKNEQRIAGGKWHTVFEGLKG